MAETCVKVTPVSRHIARGRGCQVESSHMLRGVPFTYTSFQKTLLTKQACLHYVLPATGGTSTLQLQGKVTLSQIFPLTARSVGEGGRGLGR